MYWHKNNFIVKLLYPSFVWDKPTQQKVIYLTFDDGPIPDITEWVLDVLQEYAAKATFFCVGDNIRKHPYVFEKVHANGHSIGNHTFNHLNGWKTEQNLYIDNVASCQQMIGQEPRLFRPPYGRISRKQAGLLRQQGYQITMWDVLSGDFDAHLASNKCLKKSIEHTTKGSIIVFHDSIKAASNLKFVLPRYLAHFTALGYQFEKL